MENSKWFLKSKTIWGLIVSAFGAFAPMAQVIGWDWPSAAEISVVGDAGYAFGSAIATFGGILFAFYGRIKAVVQTWVVNKPSEPTPPVAPVA